MGRERKNEGKPRKRADGTWVQYLDLGYQNGRRIRKKVESKDRAEVVRKIVELRRKHAAGIDITLKPQTMTLLLRTWLDEDVAPNARVTTLETYRWAIERCLVPHIGDLLPDKLTRRHVQRMMAALVAQGMAARSITLVRTVLRKALQQAIIDDLLDKNVAALTKPPKLERSPGKALSKALARALLDAARGDRLGVAIRVALSLGLRRGEVCGLRWEDIDFVKGTLTIRGRIVSIPRQGLIWDEPKTEKGRRTLKLGAKLLAALYWHQTRLEAERKAMGDRDGRTRPMYSSPCGAAGRSTPPCCMRRIGGSPKLPALRATAFTTCATVAHRSWRRKATPASRPRRSWAMPIRTSPKGCTRTCSMTV